MKGKWAGNMAHYLCFVALTAILLGKVGCNKIKYPVPNGAAEVNTDKLVDTLSKDDMDQLSGILDNSEALEKLERSYDVDGTNEENTVNGGDQEISDYHWSNKRQFDDYEDKKETELVDTEVDLSAGRIEPSKIHSKKIKRFTFVPADETPADGQFNFKAASSNAEHRAIPPDFSGDGILHDYIAPSEDKGGVPMYDDYPLENNFDTGGEYSDDNNVMYDLMMPYIPPDSDNTFDPMSQKDAPIMGSGLTALAIAAVVIGILIFISVLFVFGYVMVKRKQIFPSEEGGDAESPKKEDKAEDIGDAKSTIDAKAPIKEEKSQENTPEKATDKETKPAAESRPSNAKENEPNKPLTRPKSAKSVKKVAPETGGIKPPGTPHQKTVDT